ncbi:MAG: HNH endonuclease [Bacillota bacterium]|nr:HNH endonuclease [Bacillota bacterium]MDW7678071.1 HNH endonuclease [Bacillota bacterium]
MISVEKLARKQKEFNTIREYMYWVYANLTMAHAAIKNGHCEYERTDFMVRSRLLKGLREGTMSITSLYDDEKLKISVTVCCYCGADTKLTLDHLVSRKAGGKDSGDNIVHACKTCNSSKGSKDLIEWKLNNDEFPPILTLRRYLKIAIEYLKENDYLDRPFTDLQNLPIPFRLELLPYTFPQPSELRL